LEDIMGTSTQSPAELIRACTLGLATAQEVCNGITGWESDVRVGGFINLHDCTSEIRDLFDRSSFNVVWPEGLTMPVDEAHDDHAALVKAFRKAASKAAKKAKKAGTSNVAQPFSKLEYKDGAELVKLGYCQLHASMVINNVKVAVHFWSRPSPNTGWELPPLPMLAKFKIDKEEQLALFL
jgi:hypothetical protein